MITEPIIVLVTDFRHKRAESLCRVVVASSIRAFGFPIEQWVGRVLSADSSSVACRIRNVESIAVGVGDKGEKYLDDEPLVLTTLEEDLREAAANRLEIIAETSSFRWSCPVFISSNPGLVPRIQKVRIRLEVQNLSNLPDVQAYIAYGEMMDRLFQESVLSGSSHTERLKKTARATAIQVGQFLPVATDDERGVVHGVIHLERQVDSSIFEATLLLSDCRSDIESGMSLVRVVKWEENEALCKRTALIATIL